MQEDIFVLNHKFRLYQKSSWIFHVDIKGIS